MEESYFGFYDFPTSICLREKLFTLCFGAFHENQLRIRDAVNVRSLSVHYLLETQFCYGVPGMVQ